MEFRKPLGITISKPSARRCGEVPALNQSEEGLAENGVHGNEGAFFVFRPLRRVLSSEVRGWMVGIGGASAALQG